MDVYAAHFNSIAFVRPQDRYYWRVWWIAPTSVVIAGLVALVAVPSLGARVAGGIAASVALRAFRYHPSSRYALPRPPEEERRATADTLWGWRILIVLLAAGGLTVGLAVTGWLTVGTPVGE